MSALNKAMNLAFFELLGDPDQINTETERYLAVTADDIRLLSAKMFRKENSSTLIYLAQNHD